MKDEMGVLRIRNVRDDERNLVRALTLDAYEEFATLMEPEFWVRYREQLLRTLDAVDPSVERILAEQDRAIVGSVLLYPPASGDAYGAAAQELHDPEVRLLAVAPYARGCGVALALMNECERRARAAGAIALGLHTMDVMVAAVRLYARLGFERAAERDFIPVPGFVVKGYRRRLSGP